MSTDPNLERRLADHYAAETPPRAPAWVLERVLASVETTAQRRTVFGRPWRVRTMPSTVARLGVGVAAVAIAAIGLVALALSRSPIVGPGATPSQTPLASPPDSPALAQRQGKWIATGNMVRRRTEGHSVTLLGDGRVLVAGGGDATSGSATKAAELYDPATGTWTATGDMLGARFDHTATLLSDGRVLVAGGGASFADERVLASAELYDPRTGTWRATAGMIEARRGHTATLLPDGRVLIAGGWLWVADVDGAHREDLASAELYDPVTRSWSATTAIPAPRGAETATRLLDGRVLLVGATAHLYDPATASWTPTERMSPGFVGVASSATLLRNGRVLLAGFEFPLKSRAELYDPQTDSWTQTGDMIEKRAWFAAGLLPDGRVLVAGSGDGGYGGSPTAELYDPSTGTWTLTPNMLSKHGYHEGVTLNDGRFLVVGGYGPLGEPSAETYDLSR